LKRGGWVFGGVMVMSRMREMCCVPEKAELALWTCGQS
jgi:hypothetical protein